MTSSSGDAPQIPVSWGELIDKITILEIKRERIAAPDAAANIAKELSLLRGISEHALGDNNVAELATQLGRINRELWDVEDLLREKESVKDFGPAFVELARSVYRLNDARNALKRRINLLLNSGLVEEKSYGARPGDRKT